MSVSYAEAPEVAAIAEPLVRKYHPDLWDVRIEYVFRSEAAKSGGRIVFGKARKVTGINAFLSSPDVDDQGVADLSYFVIEIALDTWDQLDAAQREALVDHELCHCATYVDEDDDSVVLKLRSHDLEEYAAIVKRHGLWRPELDSLVRALGPQQLRLLAEEGQE